MCTKTDDRRLFPFPNAGHQFKHAPDGITLPSTFCFHSLMRDISIQTHRRFGDYLPDPRWFPFPNAWQSPLLFRDIDSNAKSEVKQNGRDKHSIPLSSAVLSGNAGHIDSNSLPTKPTKNPINSFHSLTGGHIIQTGKDGLVLFFFLFVSIP